MKNELFQIEFDSQSGGISSLILNSDVHRMNFVKESYHLNQPKIVRRAHTLSITDLKLVSFHENLNTASARYKATGMELSTQYSFTKEGCLRVTNRLRSTADQEWFLQKGEFGMLMPFADEYPNAKECMTNRCHTHIWTGLEGASYICCLKMGNERDNLGVLVTKGGWESYSQLDVKSNNRGVFLLHPDLKILAPKEEYILEYEIFPCTGVLDFKEKCRAYENYVEVSARQYTLFLGEELVVEIDNPQKQELSVTMFYDGKEEGVPFACENDGRKLTVKYLPKKEGEYQIFVKRKQWETYLTCLVVPPLKKLLEKRIRFIVNHQQYHREGSALDGAYLVYDNEEKRCFYNEAWPDLNGARERVGMGILIASYLQENYDEKIYQSLIEYEAFIRREIYEDQTGQIYDDIGRNEKNVRLYNFLWVAHFYTELFYLTHEEKYLQDVYKIVCCYYRLGGEHHYPNAVSVLEFLDLMKKQGKMKEYDEIWKLFSNHIEHIMENGCEYPKHEVNYEQTIVSPAVALLLDACAFEQNENVSLRTVMETHLHRLERFDGFAPHYKLNTVAIRFWDDFWFGKKRLFGDTFPHYWSCLSAVNYCRYDEIFHSPSYRYRGEKGLRNCLCLFFKDGSASCASLFPYRSNQRECVEYDAYANDQDFALYYAWKYLKQAERMKRA